MDSVLLLCPVCNGRFDSPDSLRIHSVFCRNSSTVKNSFPCGHCGKSLSRMDNLKRHIAAAHSTEPRKKRRRKTAESNENDHQQIDNLDGDSQLIVPAEKKEKPKCPVCLRTFDNEFAIERHTWLVHSTPETFAPLPNSLPPVDIGDDPTTITPEILQQINDTYLPDVAGEIIRNWNIVETRNQLRTDLLKVRHIRTTVGQAETGDYLRRVAESLFNEQRNVFKLDVAFTTVNQVKGKDDLVIRYAGDNSRLFETLGDGPVLIQSMADLQQVYNIFDSWTVVEFLQKLREDSNTYVRDAVSATFYITDIDDLPLMGCADLTELPADIVKCLSIHKFLRDNHNTFDDNKCVLRCAAVHIMKNDKRNPQPSASVRTPGFSDLVRDLEAAFCRNAKLPISQTFAGVKLCDIHHLEDAAQIDINVYRYVDPVQKNGQPEANMAVIRENDDYADVDDIFNDAAVEGPEEQDGYDDLNEVLLHWENREGFAGQTVVDNNPELLRSDSEESIFVPPQPEPNQIEKPIEMQPYYILVHRSLGRYKRNANFIQFGNHWMYATNLSAIFCNWMCDCCKKLFRLKDLYNIHMKKGNCNKRGQHVKYASGGFRPRLTLFERLERLGHNVPLADRFYDYHVVFDYESITVKQENLHVPFEPLIPLLEPQLPLSKFTGLTTPELAADFRRQFQGQFKDFLFANQSDLLTAYKSNGHNIILLPQDGLQQPMPFDEIVAIVRPFVHQLLARQTINYTLQSVKLHWGVPSEYYDDNEIALAKESILPKAVKINTAQQALDALQTFRINSVPFRAKLFSVGVHIKVVKHQWLEPLMPVSFSLNSTVPRLYKSGQSMMEPLFSVIPPDTPDELMPVEVTKLVIRMYEFVNEISDAAKELLTAKYKTVLDELKAKDEQFKSAKRLNNEQKRKLSGKQRLCGEETLVSLELQRKETLLIMANTHDHSDIYKELLSFIECIPVMGFNSSRFDLNLIRKDLFCHALHNKDVPSIIKRGKAYMSIKFKKAVYLDCCNYMGPSISLVNFLQAWGIEDKKSSWPYQWFCSIGQLRKGLPDIRAFDCDGIKHFTMPDGTYKAIQQLWAERGFTSMLDMLQYYNNCDTVGFSKGVSKMSEFWREHGIDALKGGNISLPGLSMSLMFSEEFLDPEIVFNCWTKKYGSFFELMKQETVGGASIIFNRLSIAGKTRIKSGHLCQAVAGFDSNSLYLDCLMQKLPTGLPTFYKCLAEELDPDIEDVEHQDQLSRDMSTDEFGWIDLEKRPDGQFYSDFELLQLNDPHLIDAVERSKTERPEKDAEDIENEEWILNEQKRKLTKVQHFWLTQRFSHERVMKNGYKELIFLMQTKQDMEKQLKLAEGTLRLETQFNGQQRRIRLANGSAVFVDGFCPDTAPQTVIQYQGCYHHGHWADSLVVDPSGGVTGGCYHVRTALNRLKENPTQLQEKWDHFKQRQIQTRTITELLRQRGFTVVEGWECETDFELKFSRQADLKRLRAKHLQPEPPTAKTVSGFELLEGVKRGSFFGLMEVDIRLPEYDRQLRREHDEFPLIFRNVELTIDHLSPRMRHMAKENNIMNEGTRRKTLISSHYGPKMLLATPLLKFYLENGCVVTRIYSAMEFQPVAVFEKLGNQVQSIRREGDVDSSKSQKSSMAKLIGNSCFGKTLTNISRHQQIKLMNLKSAKRAAMSPRYQRSEYLTTDTYEIALRKAGIVHKLPAIIGFFIFSLSKLKVLEFEKFLRTHLSRARYCPLEMDTDSIYVSLGGSPDPLPNLSEIKSGADLLSHFVPPENMASFMEQAPKYLCSLNKLDYSHRQPGLFKIELYGFAMVALSSKLYVCFDEEKDEDGKVTGRKTTKMACKGLMAKSNPHVGAEQYLDALHKQTVSGGTNCGFAMGPSGLQIYKCQRDSINSFYCKRQVKNNLVETTPLSI